MASSRDLLCAAGAGESRREAVREPAGGPLLYVGEGVVLPKLLSDASARELRVAKKTRSGMCQRGHGAKERLERERGKRRSENRSAGRSTGG